METARKVKNNPKRFLGFPNFVFTPIFLLPGEVKVRGNESIYLHRSGPLLENGLDRPENRCGRYGFASFSSISISTVGFKSGKSKRGLSKGGLSPKGANRAKKGPFGAISALPPWQWGAEELVPIDPEKAPTSPEMAPICPEKA